MDGKIITMADLMCPEHGYMNPPAIQYRGSCLGCKLDGLTRQLSSLLELHPASDWTEEDGVVLWWHLPIKEPPMVGNHQCMGEQDIDGDPTPCRFYQKTGYLTHWSRIPRVYDPVCHCGITRSHHSAYDNHSFEEMETLESAEAKGVIAPNSARTGQEVT